MENSPFPYQGPLDPQHPAAHGRLIDDLIERVSERRVTALLGPRRFGKTTALRVVADRLRDTSITIWLDLYELSSWADFAVRLDRAVAAATLSGGTELADLAASLEIRLGVLNLEFRKPAREWPDPQFAVSALIELVVRTAKAQPVALIIDEFSGVAGVPGVAGLLRTELQHHFGEVGLLFAGSEPSTMQLLFTDRAEPFYAQADLIEMPPLSLDELTEILRVGFESTGREAGNLAASVHEATGGHPHRAMQLADALWRRTAPGSTADRDGLLAARADVRSATSAGMERLFSSFPSGEQRVLRVLAQGESLFSPYAVSLGLTNGGAAHARDALTDRGHLAKQDGRHMIVDPFLGEWVRLTFG